MRCGDAVAAADDVVRLCLERPAYRLSHGPRQIVADRRSDLMQCPQPPCDAAFTACSPEVCWPLVRRPSSCRSPMRRPTVAPKVGSRPLPAQCPRYSGLRGGASADQPGPDGHRGADRPARLSRLTRRTSTGILRSLTSCRRSTSPASDLLAQCGVTVTPTPISEILQTL